MCCKYAVGAFGVEHMHVGILCFQAKQFVGSVLKGALDPWIFCALIISNNTVQTVFMEPALPFIPGTF